MDSQPLTDSSTDVFEYILGGMWMDIKWNDWDFLLTCSISYTNMIYVCISGY